MTLYRLDMTTMFTIHDAFRRQLLDMARVAASDDSEGTASVPSQPGWQLFKKFLTVHHQSEDDVVWPVLRNYLTDHPDRMKVVEELEAEHAAIEPLLQAIEDAPAGRPDLIGDLAAQLTAHLAHEESDGLGLIDAFFSPEEWQQFARVHGARLLDDAPSYVPWLLDGAEPRAVEQFLRNIPPPLATAYRVKWAADYAAVPLWGAPRDPQPTSAHHG
jgi:hypothetical protein